MRKLIVTLPRYLPLVKILLIVAIAAAIAVAGGAPAIFAP
jgi:hypothetical protein